MPQISLILTSLIFSINLLTFAFAQSVARESPNLPQLSEPINLLDHATGWFKDEVGEWHSNERAIGNDFSKNIEGTLESYHRSQVEDFKQLELRTVSVDGKELYVLMKHHVTGHYRYPSIREDWQTDNSVDFCAFAKAELEKVTEALGEKEVAQRVSFPCTYGSSISDAFLFDSSLEKEIIARFVSNSFDPETLDIVHIDIFPVVYEGEDLVRFHWVNEGTIYFPNTFDPAKFDQSYYEVDLQGFNELFAR